MSRTARRCGASVRCALAAANSVVPRRGRLILALRAVVTRRTGRSSPESGLRWACFSDARARGCNLGDSPMIRTPVATIDLPAKRIVGIPTTRIR